MRKKMFKQRSRGQIIILLALMGVLIFGFAGLAADSVYAYAVKSLLVTAVDAAALAGSRELTESTSAAAAAVERTFNANFPDKAMLTLTRSYGGPTVQNELGQRRLIVTGTATIPTFFMKMFGYDTLDLSARATAVRKDLNLMLVLDRSGSMSRAAGSNPGPTAFHDLQFAAKNFVDQFDQSRDRFGLVSFGTTANLDHSPATNFKNPIKNSIDAMVSDNSGTNSAEGLWLAYNALDTLNDPNVLNIIVFFTDGASTVLTSNYAITSGLCTGQQRQGHAWGYSSSTSNAARGLNALSAGPPPVPAAQELFLPGCGFGASVNLETLIPRLPLTDLHSTSVTGPRTIPQWNGAYPSTRGDVIRVAAANATINTASRARQDVGTPVTIFGVGLGGNLPAPEIPLDVDLLMRVSNADSPANPAFNPAEPAGKAFVTQTANQLEKLFNQVAGEILRLIE